MVDHVVLLVWDLGIDPESSFLEHGHAMPVPSAGGRSVGLFTECLSWSCPHSGWWWRGLWFSPLQMKTTKQSQVTCSELFGLNWRVCVCSMPDCLSTPLLIPTSSPSGASLGKLTHPSPLELVLLGVAWTPTSFSEPSGCAGLFRA